jgi:outer membrane cobalamin receptor
MKSLIYHLLVFTIIFYFSSYAQNANHIIKGNIFDSKSDVGIEFANISLYKSTDSTILTGSASGKNGEFIIHNVPPGKYYMKINFIGYKTKIVQNISLAANQKEVTLGKIKMEESTILLNETEVVGKRQLEEYRLDKKIINISQDISSVGGNALEAMQKLPSVRTDAKGDIIIRGSSNYTVLVDGRPSVLSGSDALRQIPANIIDNIELITNPSAKYDAEGTGGIINIITKKKFESYLSSVANLEIGSKSRRNADLSINHKGDDFLFTAGADYRKQPNCDTRDFNRETYGSTESEFNSSFVRNERIRETYNIRLGLDYNLDAKNSLSLNALMGYTKLDYSQRFQVHKYSSLSDVYSYVQDNIFTDSRYYNAALNYLYKFSCDNELTAEILYLNVGLPLNDANYDFISNSDFTYRSPEPIKRYFDDKSGRDRIRFKTNYSHKINSTSNFEAGLQTNLLYKHMDVVNKVFNWENNIWEVTSDITNKMNFRENVYSAFVTYSSRFYDFDYQMGLRAEFTDRLLDQKTMNQKYDYKKLHLFPSLHVSKKISASQSLSLSYSRRITRPNDTWLNPYITYSDSYVVNYGNPYLKPETTDSYELNYQTSINGLFLSIETYLKSSNNSIYQFFKVDQQNRLTITNDNYKTITNSGIEISSNFTLLNKLQLSPSINLYNCSRNGNSSDLQNNGDNFSWSAKTRFDLLLSNNTIFVFLANYNAKQFFQQAEMKPVWSFLTGVQQSLFDKKLVLTLKAENLFKYTQDISLKNIKFSLFDTQTFEKNIISLSASFNFNNFKKSKSEPNIDINPNN